MGRREEMAKKVNELMYKPDMIRNIGIVAHIDHGKTTLTDNLIFGAGLMAEELAGKELAMDSYKLEVERGITIFSANISMVYDYEGKPHLINLIDTPGHVDFGGGVTRALRAVDGAVVVVCAVEGAMPQTETVLRQALKEKVKPVLFINKTDRLINELQLDAAQMQERLVKIIGKVNELIRKYAPEEYKEAWQVSVEKGSVAIGSAYNNWAISYPFMQKSGLSFKDIYEHCKEEKQKELARKLPLYQVLLDMIIKHLPNPVEAQKYRIKHIWGGDAESEIGKGMINCSKDAKAALMITSINIDPHAGEVATARLYSGTISKGKKVQLINQMKETAIQQVGVQMNTGRINVEEIPAGNIASIIGLKDAFAGETACEEKIEPFESIKHYSEPVITKSIEAKNPKDLPKLIEVLRQIAKEDSTVRVEINQETGEHLISGMGELHLEIIEHIIREDKGVDIVTSEPIVVYRETVGKESEKVEGKSPNRHNKFYIIVEPLEEEFFKAIIEGEVPEGKPRDPKAIVEKLVKRGIPRDEAKSIWFVHNDCVLLDMTKGVIHLNEAKELVVQAFKEAMDAGPLAQEKCMKVKVNLIDAKLHEDAVHRGPAQTIPAVKRGILAAILLADASLLEPKQKLFISVPQEYMGGVSNDVQGRRGQVLDTQQDEDLLSLTSKVPVAEMFGFAAEIRSVTQGRALWSTEYLGYEPLPKARQPKIIEDIRKRKGLKAESPTAQDFLS